jgi:uncharacterized protein YceH (UPF0502 family)
MSDETPSSQPWPVLSPLERRLLGVLVEKQKTTPDVYPMSLNGIVTGCNQKNNRDPLMSVEGPEVESALEGLQEKVLVTRVQSGRVDKWRHLLYERWNLEKAGIAVLAELLLRGPQSEGDLRGRVSRMERIDSLDALRAVCRPLAEHRLVVYLTPEGRRGTTLTHGLHDLAELDRLRSHAEGDVATSPRIESALAPPSRLDRLEAELADLRRQVAELQSEFAASGREKRSSSAPPQTPG